MADRGSGEQKSRKYVNPFALWFVTSVLWAAAIVIAIDERWTQTGGHGNPYTDQSVWLVFLLPPIVFAVAIGAWYVLIVGGTKR